MSADAEHRFSVRRVAEFVHRRGNLYDRVAESTTAEEGRAAQRHVQSERGEDYASEVAVSHELRADGVALLISGRADGVETLDTNTVLVEEIKASRSGADELLARAGSHIWAQAMLYAAILANDQRYPQPDWLLRIVVVHPDQPHHQSQRERRASREELAEFLAHTCRDLHAWLCEQHAHRLRRNAALRALAWPHAAYRPYQRAALRAVHESLVAREPLLLEAPTGSGKTLTTLFPALKAIGQESLQRVFYLTARNSGQAAARDALALCGTAGDLRVATIRAKANMCAVPGTPCDPAQCRYAAGYFDRSRDAVAAVLAADVQDPDQVAKVAEAFTVCPFELSLDAALWADVVIGDYNYWLDPLVRLKRFAREKDAALLIDEAHHLSRRVSDMLCAEVDTALVATALAEAPADPVRRTVTSVQRAMGRVRRGAGVAARAEHEQAIDYPRTLVRSADRLLEQVAVTDVAFSECPALAELCLAARRLIALDLLDDATYVTVLQSNRRSCTIRVRVADAAPHIARIADQYATNVRFSATVTPLRVFARLHGDRDGRCERGGDVFDPDQLGVFVVPGVSAAYRRRQADLPRLAQLVRTVARSKTGRYLIALPSFSYLDALAVELGDAPDLLTQERSMSQDAVACLLRRFGAPLTGEEHLETHPASASRLLLAVMGGSFTESMDALELHGTVIVGPGYPPPSVELDAMRAQFDAAGEDGQLLAYEQPGMTRVVQAAGRVVRRAGQRGVVILADPRFLEPRYQQFFPGHWQPNTARLETLGTQLDTFWRQLD